MKTPVITLAILTLLLSGCSLRWQANLPSAAASADRARAEALLEEAENDFARSGDQASIMACIESFEAVLEADPTNLRALERLSTLHILVGTAYTEKSSDKRARFRQSMDYATAAMSTNPEFRTRLEAGKKVWDAAGVLDDREVEAAFLWVTALQYDFKEVMSLPSKIINVKWMRRALAVLERIETVAPEFGGGGVEFAKVICLYTLPKRWGGSKEEGDRLMEASVARSEGWLLPRWARGKYFHPIKKEHDKARRDLEWVIAQDPGAVHDPHPWKVHFQEDAAAILGGE